MLNKLSFMETFIESKKITDIKSIKLVHQFIKFSSKTISCKGIEFVINTYTIKLPKNMFEDDVYAKYPELLNILPRACSIITNNGIVIGAMEGPTKFSGRTNVDEDPDEEEQETEQTIFDFSKIKEWAELGQLEILKTTKANGKFAIVKIINGPNGPIMIVGSKNMHFLMEPTIDSIDAFIVENSASSIVNSILTDIKKYLHILLEPDMMKFFSSYSLCGELCDGLHFTAGDNTISWFGLFTNGIAMETMKCLTLLSNFGLKTVEFSKVYGPEMKVEDLENVFTAARCEDGEGTVLRCQNVETGNITLVKTKSVSYIVKRMLRGILERDFTRMIPLLLKRFIDTQSYHGLGTNASIRVTNQLLSFAFYMLDKKYPGHVLGHQSNGFYYYWSTYLKETGKSDIIIQMDDFGVFDEEAYKIGTSNQYPIRSFAEPATVVFLQGLQGSGKTTSAKNVCKLLAVKNIQCKYLEQDEFDGDTNACKGALFHMVASASGPKVIIVSRCNMEQKQYTGYLLSLKQMPCVVLFVSPKTVNPLYWAVSLAGIYERSSPDYQYLTVGKSKIEVNTVIDFVTKNYRNYTQAHPTNLINIITDNSVLLSEATKMLTCGEQAINKFIQDNQKELLSYRLPIENVANQIVNIIETATSNNMYIVNQKPIYIGCAVSTEDKMQLTKVCKQLSRIEGGITYIHHMTQKFLGGKTDAPTKMVVPGATYKVAIDALVVRKCDNACAFRIHNDGSDIFAPINNIPHITAWMPHGMQPVESNKFISIMDDTVVIHKMDYELNLVGFWF